MRSQRGFTLLELMVSMAIFAMLAVAGWQVFDGVNRARERAQVHADHLAVLQYAYLQLQQDMAQVIPYQAPSSQNISATNNSTSANDSTNGNAQAKEIAPEPFMSLDGEHVSFVRFSDPDPRYQSGTSVQRIEYIFTDERLIRRQYTGLEGDSVSLDSVLLEGVTAGRWQAYMPEPSDKFPTNDSADSNSANTALAQMVNGASTAPDAILLPKGIAVSFTYQDMPITWQWALAPQAISQRPPNTNGRPNSTNTKEGNNSGNSNDANNNSDTSNGSVENAN